MKKISKVTIAMFVSSFFTTAAFAATPPAKDSGEKDASVAAVEWTGGVPIVVPGKYTKITGLNGGALVQGELDVNMDGSFGSKAGSVGQVITELHLYDADTETVGAMLTDADATNLSWSVISNPIVSSSGSTETATAKAILTANTSLGQQEMDMAATPISGTPDQVNRVTWTVHSTKDGNLVNVNQGDTVSVSATVQAETTF